MKSNGTQIKAIDCALFPCAPFGLAVVSLLARAGGHTTTAGKRRLCLLYAVDRLRRVRLPRWLLRQQPASAGRNGKRT